MQIQDLETGFESDQSVFFPFFLFMPLGTPLLLGRVLLNYLHRLTRLLRDLIFLNSTDFPFNITIGPSTLTPAQVESRKYFRILDRNFYHIF